MRTPGDPDARAAVNAYYDMPWDPDRDVDEGNQVPYQHISTLGVCHSSPISIPTN